MQPSCESLLSAQERDLAAPSELDCLGPGGIGHGLVLDTSVAWEAGAPGEGMKDCSRTEAASGMRQSPTATLWSLWTCREVTGVAVVTTTPLYAEESLGR